MLERWEAGLGASVGTPDAPSVAYAVAQGETTLALGGFGATSHTPFALASVTKPMTATAVMMLAEEGLLDLDAPADVRLQRRAGDVREATVRRVLGHTAGLPLHYRFHYADEPPARPPFAEILRRYGKTLFAPGARFLYSNLGYGVLGDLVARVSGVPYGAAMAERVFGPLGMADASIGRPSGGATPTSPTGEPYPPYDTDHPGGSDAWGSAADLLAFGRFHLGHGPSPLSLSARRAMREGVGYGLGWQIADRRGRRLVEHTGAMGGTRAILRLVPELDLAIALVANGEGDLPFRAADDALAALDPVFREGIEPVRTGAGVPVPPAWDGLFSGRIETPDGDRLFALELQGGEGEATLEGRTSPVAGTRILEGRLVGAFDGDLLVADARRPYRVHLDLVRRGDRLTGAASAVARPGPRQGDALSFWTELDRI